MAAVVILTVLAAVLLGACDRGPRNERTADSIEEAAIEAVDRLDDIAWDPAHAHPAGVDLEGIAADALAPATVVAVSSLIGHGENTWVAVTDEHAFVLPTDYNRLIAQHPVTVRDSDDAWALIDLYLRMHESRLGAMGLEPIDTIEEVTGSPTPKPPPTATRSTSRPSSGAKGGGGRGSSPGSTSTLRWTAGRSTSTSPAASTRSANASPTGSATKPRS